MGEESRAILENYADGVNAWIEGKAPGDLAAEYNFVSLLAGEVTIEPWTPIDSLLWVQSMLFDQERGDLSFELTKGAITEQAGPLGALVLVPPYPYDAFPIITEPGFSFPTSAAPALAGVESIPTIREMASLPTDFLIEGVGSNSWVVSGELTDTGKPYLANDPHIGIQNPAIWYQNGLHCVEVSEACAYDLYGYSFAGVPLIVIGHNQNLGWGLTNSGLDTMDVYTLELNPDNPLQYSYNGDFVDMEVIEEEILVAGGEPVTVPVRLTRFGPVINELVGFEQPLAVRWNVAEADSAYSVFVKMGKAANWDEFQAAVEQFPIGQNFIYADVEGNIGLIAGGLVPIRAAGHDGSLPMPGADSTFEWQGFMNGSELPRIFNPEQGYIVAANNALVRPENYGTVRKLWHGLFYLL
jgi:penicillin amidase